jgi:hypothetical protein
VAAAFILQFEAALGNWTMKTYDGFSLGDQYGEIWQMSMIVINMIIFLNLTIAILSETYNRMTTTRLGLYYDGLIASLPAYEHNEHFGVLILLPPPFNVLTLLLLPLILVYRKNTDKLITINSVW